MDFPTMDGRAMSELAPWRDFAGNEIYNGDVICHPSGERVKYEDGQFSRICLQIGDKGRATVSAEGSNDG